MAQRCSQSSLPSQWPCLDPQLSEWLGSLLPVLCRTSRLSLVILHPSKWPSWSSTSSLPTENLPKMLSSLYLLGYQLL